MDDMALDVTADDAPGLRNAGTKGAPGMPETGDLLIPKKLAQQGVKDMEGISDARMSGTAFGTIAPHITPESAAGGPLALAQQAIAFAWTCRSARSSCWWTTPSCSAARAVCRPARHEGSDRGYSWLLQQHVTQADEGCDFDFLRPGHS